MGIQAICVPSVFILSQPLLGTHYALDPEPGRAVAKEKGSSLSSRGPVSYTRGGQVDKSVFHYCPHSSFQTVVSTKP